jgi:hypothetical protein
LAGGEEDELKIKEMTDEAYVANCGIVELIGTPVTGIIRLSNRL